MFPSSTILFLILAIYLLSAESPDVSKESSETPSTSDPSTESSEASNSSAEPPDLSKRVLYAVNCGGERHVGAYGIVYEHDGSTSGIASDHGSRYLFPNAPREDRKLYETERYDFGDLVYKFDIKGDGAYVVILKFSEVYFERPGMKISCLMITPECQPNMYSGSSPVKAIKA
ncbi:hypothetical protein KIN20_009751 [Parelaphostrongylus tenuis]|uniref:Malectin domain-containing protein n=1 Tax=Parelaphostrongylus tenuis TaxID=148309 RepID=A0AAD5MBL7_PARTN|nr:hypothetical protein KIN20_009751 [Parelaphostrongylus tenuis]